MTMVANDQNDPVEGPFVPYNTMFKLVTDNTDHVDPRQVECVNCKARFPLEDLTASELEENECPGCEVEAEDYYKDKLHRKVKDDAEEDEEDD